jgi:hypothetical protein
MHQFNRDQHYTRPSIVQMIRDRIRFSSPQDTSRGHSSSVQLRDRKRKKQAPQKTWWDASVVRFDSYQAIVDGKLEFAMNGGSFGSLFTNASCKEIT